MSCDSTVSRPPLRSDHGDRGGRRHICHGAPEALRHHAGRVMVTVAFCDVYAASTVYPGVGVRSETVRGTFPVLTLVLPKRSGVKGPPSLSMVRLLDNTAATDPRTLPLAVGTTNGH